MILAVTGHRPDKLGGYSSVITKELQLLAENELFRLNPEVVITGMAVGWDQAVGWAARARRIPFWAYVPFEGQDSVWPRPAREKYADLLSYAEKIVVCSPGKYEPYKMHVRNRRMVDDCTCVLALWNGTSGGTASCVAYAKEKQRELYNCWSEWTKR